ncbi:hypothetical protein B1756_12180 [Natrarchaeobaculum aegyptiacum]|uniref:Uncharacterized protein n=1 Tax=Natrarchaeobaculum aegyptiacum TaxID=745377 RepID=A0A2Z2HT55_9EURY|nr:hypothetical protein B1756_12180 [Natrarchaeobaculum aegyptiacum]
MPDCYRGRSRAGGPLEWLFPTDGVVTRLHTVSWCPSTGVTRRSASVLDSSVPYDVTTPVTTGMVRAGSLTGPRDSPALLESDPCLTGSSAVEGTSYRGRVGNGYLQPSGRPHSPVGDSR